MRDWSSFLDKDGASQQVGQDKGRLAKAWEEIALDGPQPVGV